LFILIKSHLKFFHPIVHNFTQIFNYILVLSFDLFLVEPYRLGTSAYIFRKLQSFDVISSLDYVFAELIDTHDDRSHRIADQAFSCVVN